MLVEGGVIAAPPEAVVPRHQPDAVRGHVQRADAEHEAGQRARHRVLGPFRVDAHALGVDRAVTARRAADDVAVEVGVDRRLGRRERLDVRTGADQPLLFAGPQGEDQRRVELEPAAGHHAGHLQRERGAAAVVVGARGRPIVVLSRPGQRVGRRRRIRGARGVEPHLPGVAEADRVVVGGHVDASRAPARQHRQDVAQLDVAGDPPLLRHPVDVVAHLQARARRPQLAEQPLAGGADATRRRRGRRQGVPGPEGGQRVDGLAEAGLGDAGDQRLQSWVDVRSRRLRARHGDGGEEEDDTRQQRGATHEHLRRSARGWRCRECPARPARRGRTRRR